MLQFMTAIMDKTSKGSLVILSIAIFALFLIVILPAQKKKVESYAGEAGSIDMSFFLSPEKVYSIAEAYGEDGRRQYIRARVTFDVVWPLAYTFFMVSLITFCLKRVVGEDSKWMGLNLVAIAPIIFDFIENGMAVTIMSAYPDRMDTAARIMAAATAVKWITMSLAFLILTVALLVLPVVLIRSKISS